MSRILFVALSLLATTARADASWTLTRSHPIDDPRAELWAGTRGLAIGTLLRSGWGAELRAEPSPGVAELAGGKRWILAAVRAFSLSAHVGGAAYVPYLGRFDPGLGPHAGVNAGVQWWRLRADVSAQAGAELFVASSSVRYPVRAGLAIGFELGGLELFVRGRLGNDFMRGPAPTRRYEINGGFSLSLPPEGVGRAQ